MSDAVQDTRFARQELYRDRWSSFGQGTGILSLSERLTPAEMKKYWIFQEFDDVTLERISPDVSVAVWAPGSVLFEEGSYIDLGFVIVEGEVELFLARQERGDTAPNPIFDPGRTIVATRAGSAPPEGLAVAETLFASQVARQETSRGITFLSVMDIDLTTGTRARVGSEEVFGEIGALGGWPQSVTARTVTRATLLQLRLPALRMMRGRSKALKARLDGLYRERSLGAQLKASPLFRGCARETIQFLLESVELVSLDPGETIAREGDPADAVYMIRSGFLKVSQKVGEGSMGVTYLSKGMTFGEIELVMEGLDRWTASASSVEYTELVKIGREDLERVIAESPGIREALLESTVNRIREIGARRRNVENSKFLDVALETGLVQGNSVLVIDLNRCTRCDDCVRGCAATHGGMPRFVREGDKYENLQIAKSCYHCRDPVCLVGCPTGSIRRAQVGDVVEIDEPLCIGCGTCARNCPYDAIVMYDTGTKWPENVIPEGKRGEPKLLASKCDLCFDRKHEPACVLSCPNQCAFRVGSLEEIQRLIRVTGGE